MQQNVQSLQQESNPDIIKITFLLIAFGVVGYLWVKTSRLLIEEIEK